ncbi:hypothetical protein WJX82_002423 [Trebouxia sp. C0006]
MWASRTRQLQAAHVTVFDRLWSILPFLRPMVTITGDSLKDYGKDGEGLNDQDKYFMKACPAKKGDYFEFFAEIDILAALSTCPGGDLSVPLWGPNARDPLEVCRPLGVEVYKVHSDVLQGWKSPEKAAYAGRHGLAAKAWA